MSDANNSRALGRSWLIGLMLVLGTLACYWPVRHFEFLNYDDPGYVWRNSMVQRGLTWSSVVWALRSTAVCNWHPLTWLSYMADYQVWGLSPGGYHLTNLLLHTANVVLLFLLLRQMTGAMWRSAFVAALFAWHPMHVESVAWIAERKDVLSAFFFLLTLSAYGRYVEQSKVQRAKAKVWYGLMLVCFALGLMSKPMVVTLPFLLLLLDYWPLRRLGPGTQDSRLKTLLPLLSEKLPFFVLALVSSVVTFYAQKSGGAIQSFEQVPLGLRLENAPVAYATYMGKLFWPQNLVVLYVLPNSFATWQVAVAALLLAVVSLAVIRPAGKYPYLFTGWFWFAGMLVPVIGLVQLQLQARADRYTYLPYIGLSLMLAWGVPALLGQNARRQAGLAWAGAAALAGCLICTRTQIHHWRDSLALFQHAVEATPGSYAAQSNLGSTLVDQGKYELAEQHCAEAVRLRSNSAGAQCNLGNVLMREGKREAALGHFEETVRLNPRFPEGWNSLGKAYVLQQKLDEALASFAAAVRINPKLQEAHYNLGMTRGLKGEWEAAATELATAVRLAPGDSYAQNMLATALAKLQIPEATPPAASNRPPRLDLVPGTTNVGAPK